MDPIKYLRAKLKPGRGRPAVAILSLRKLPEVDHDTLIKDCRDELAEMFKRTSGRPVMFGAAVAKMGRQVVRHLRKYEILDKDAKVSDKDEFYYGEPLIEVILNTSGKHYVERQSDAWDAPNIIGLTKPDPVYDLRYTKVGSKIPTITKLMREYDIPRDPEVKPNEGSLIQRWGRGHSRKFKELLDRPFVESANRLQQTGWQINTDVLSIILEDHYDKFVTPDYKLKDPRTLTGTARDDMQSLISKATASKATLSKAQQLAGETFYQYVNYDWRGRVYYMESFLNFQGNDLARGLLRFDEAKPLGESGLFWLAVHTANSFNQSYPIDQIPEWCEVDYKSLLESQGLTSISVDKMSLEDRARWTHYNRERILLTGFMGGLPDCEKPVSFLACCLEYVKMDGMSNPEWHFCALPISVDGSNNGWQHLGAMLKDELTGSLVGMVPAQAPNDLYVRVAQEIVANMPEFFEGRGMAMKQIRKAIAKRGVMTKAYSAGEGAIAENMWDDVRQAGYDKDFNITEDDCKALAKTLVTSISTVCPKPMEAMGCLQSIASEHMVGEGSSIPWTSPSGFPVEQVYMNKDPAEVQLKFRVPKSYKGIPVISGTTKVKFIEYSDYPDRGKHASSISPNFVHSQDAAHLAVVVANCGGPFGAVHDSFSMHAGDIEDLLVLTKEVFIEMYDTDNFLGDVAERFGVEIDLPEVGGLDIEDVINCDFFFA